MKKYLVLAATLLSLACNSNRAPQASAEARPDAPSPVAAPVPPAPPANQELTLVSDSSQVCMVNNQFMGRPQIPIAVEGKTYFGCCEMCKKRLGTEAAARTAKDPVSGNAVDKATAVIAKRPTGEVVYFESAETFERYRTM